MAFYIYYRADGVIDRIYDTLTTPPAVAGLTVLELPDPIDLYDGRVIDGAVVLYSAEERARYQQMPAYAATWDPVACVWEDQRDSAALASEGRRQRDRLLQRCDWTQLPDVDPVIQAAWVDYRQALRDVPEQEGFPATITWPTAP